MKCTNCNKEFQDNFLEIIIYKRNETELYTCCTIKCLKEVIGK